jgi:hypothetical protein
MLCLRFCSAFFFSFSNLSTEMFAQIFSYKFSLSPVLYNSKYFSSIYHRNLFCQVLLFLFIGTHYTYLMWYLSLLLFLLFFTFSSTFINKILSTHLLSNFSIKINVYKLSRYIFVNFFLLTYWRFYFYVIFKITQAYGPLLSKCFTQILYLKFLYFLINFFLLLYIVVFMFAYLSVFFFTFFFGNCSL